MKSPGHFTLFSSSLSKLRIIDRLEYVHKRGILYRDIKLLSCNIQTAAARILVVYRIGGCPYGLLSDSH